MSDWLAHDHPEKIEAVQELWRFVRVGTVVAQLCCPAFIERTKSISHGLKGNRRENDGIIASSISGTRLRSEIRVTR